MTAADQAPPGRPVESSQALDRGLRLLALLAEAERGLSVSELAEGLRTSRAAVYRLVAALEAHAMVRRPAGERAGRVRLGLGLLDLARRVLPELRDAARGPLRTLAERAGATAHLTVLDGDDALAVAVVEPSWTEFHVAYRVGTRHPPDRGAAGRAILLGRAPATGADVAVTVGELQPGAHGVAAPVRDVPGLEASVGVVALADLDTASVGPVVVEAAAALARRLR